MANVVRILITAKDEMSGTIDKVQDKLTLLSKTDIGKGMVMGAGIAAFGMVKNAAFGALDAVQAFAAGSVEAYRQEEVGIARLGASLRANVAAWDGNTEALERNIKAAMNKSGFSDDAIRESLSRLLPVTKDVTKAFSLQAVAMDLARFKGISLEEASVALVKVEGGQYRALKELGIVLKTGATQTEALAAVQRVAGGQMATYMDTAAGRTDVLSNKIDNLQEALGERLSPALATATELAINFLDALDPDAPMKLEDRIGALSDALSVLNPMTWGVNYSMGQLEEKQRAAADAAEAVANKTMAYSRYLRANHLAAMDAADGTGDFSDSTDHLTDRLGDLSDALRGVVDDIGKAADAMIEAEYAPEQLGLKFKIATAEVKDMKAELRKLEALKHPTAAQQTDIDKLRLRLSEGQEEVKRLRVQMALLNLSNFTTLLANLGRINKAVPHAGVMIVPAGARAAGGPIAPYGMSLVGENGPELIRAGSAGAMVTPSIGAVGRQVAPDSGSIAFYGGITLNGVGNDVSPKAGSRFAQAVLDEVAEGLRVQRARYAGSAA